MRLMNIASHQLIVIGVLFFAMLGINFFLKQYDLLYTQTGLLFGAGYTDVNITLWVYRALMALSVVAAITFAIGISKKKIQEHPDGARHHDFGRPGWFRCLHHGSEPDRVSG
jgi:Uncharacterized conserved protein